MYSSSNQTSYLDSCQVNENDVSENGGGVFIADNSTSEIRRCTFFQNEAPINGGGICVSSLTELYLSESTLEANQALNGGGIFMSGYAESIILNSTLQGNESIGNGVEFTVYPLLYPDYCLITGNITCQWKRRGVLQHLRQFQSSHSH